MIIECQACRARFRLDESKIKGKGARIRCRKCGESIIVMKGDIPPPKMSPPVEKHLFDLRAVLQEPEKGPPLPPRKEVDAAFESIKSRKRETEHAHPTAPEKPPEPSLTRDEAAAFESILDRERETDRVRAPVVEEPAPPAEEEKESFAQEQAESSLPRDEAGAAFESPLFREEEEPSPPAVEEPAPSVEEVKETFAQEQAEPSLTQDEVDAAFDSIFGQERETEQVPAPVVEEPAPPVVEERGTLSQEPMEETPPHRDDTASALDALLQEIREKESFAQEQAEPSLPRDEAGAAFESPLFHEAEEQPSPLAEEPTLLLEEERKTLAQEPMEESPPHRDDTAAGLDALLGEKREQETFAHGPAEPTLTRNELDTAFEGILGKKQESEQETPSVAEEWALPREGEDISFPLALGKEEDISSPQETGETPVRSREDLAGEEALPPPPLTEKGWDHPDQHPTEFLGLDTALPDFLRKREAARESSEPFDISEQLSEVPIGAEGEDVVPVSPTLDSPDSPDHSMDHDAARAETLQDQLSDLVESKPTEETFVPDSPPPEVPSPQPMEIERKPAIRPRPSAPSGKPSVALLALLFVILAGGGAYLAFTGTGQKTLRTLIPGMESLWLGGKESVKPYSIGNLIGYYETGDQAGRMFVIKGVATNQGRKEKSGIRIRAELLDGNHQTIAEKTVYAGNIIKGLRSTEQEKIETAMSNRFGDKLSNVDVAPGKSVPFMLVFFDPPEGIEEYRLEALDGD